jgi:hypothetical protein
MQVSISARATIAGLLPKRGVGAEIGVFRGEFSRMVFAAAQPKRLFLVDPWENSAAPEHGRSWYGEGSPNDMAKIHADVVKTFSAEPYARRVEVVRGRSAPWLAAQADGSLDFVYIDGDHGYDAVHEDITLSVAKVRKGGVIALDDYGLGKWWGDGVVRAVHEALVAQPLILMFYADGQVALRRL